MQPPLPLTGIINLNKPAGLSSARAVSRVKRLLPRGTKIGHAGTLDPFATGVLLLLIGKATRLCERLMDQPKQYLTTIKFGATTPTDDPESPEAPTPDMEPVTQEQIEAALPSFVGTILQQPPVYSALKVGGRRAYDLARKGLEVKLQPRPVVVYKIELLEFEWPFLKLRIDCGRGIRSIARGLGEVVKTGGYLVALERTKVGPFDINAATGLDQLSAETVETVIQQPPLSSEDRIL
jgi:tRNA pseudouridine55 synthase